MCAKSLLSYLTLCNPIDSPGSSVHGILQARILEWVTIPFSKGFFQLRDRTHYVPHYRQILYSLSHQVGGNKLRSRGSDEKHLVQAGSHAECAVCVHSLNPQLPASMQS